MLQRYAVPLTFLFAFDGEAKAWAALACEISVASCGDSPEDARKMIKEAVEIHVSSMIELGKAGDLAQPASAEDLAEYFSGEGVVAERHVLLVTVETEPGPKATSFEFLPSAVVPYCYPPLLAA